MNGNRVQYGCSGDAVKITPKVVPSKFAWHLTLCSSQRVYRPSRRSVEGVRGHTLKARGLDLSPAEDIKLELQEEYWECSHDESRGSTRTLHTEVAQV